MADGSAPGGAVATGLAAARAVATAQTDGGGLAESVGNARAAASASSAGSATASALLPDFVIRRARVLGPYVLSVPTVVFARTARSSAFATTSVASITAHEAAASQVGG